MNKNNYYKLVNMFPRIDWLVLFLALFILCFTPFLLFGKVYEYKNVYAMYKDDYLYIDMNVNDSDLLINGDYMLINGEKTNYLVEEISEINIGPAGNYQTFKISMDSKMKNNEISLIKIFGNKQRIIKIIMNYFVN